LHKPPSQVNITQTPDAGEKQERRGNIMEAQFNAAKEERKALVRAISEITGQEAVYGFAPSFAFTIGGVTVSRDGKLSGELTPALLAALEARGYVHEEQGEERGYSPFQGAVPEEVPDRLIITVEMPFLGEAGLDNLRKLVAGKAPLIRKALGGAEELPVVPVADRVTFPWFRHGMEPEELTAWTSFISRLCLTAKKQKRVTLRDKPVEDGASEKFAFRCFLLKLGFIGADFKEARKILLSRLEGDSSHKTGCGSKSADSTVITEVAEQE
jgi:hypothetical protein